MNYKKNYFVKSYIHCIASLDIVLTFFPEMSRTDFGLLRNSSASLLAS